MNVSAKRISLYGLLTAAALLFGYVEFLFPLSFIAPGMKLGLANAVCLYLICCKKHTATIFVNIARIVLSALLFATPFSLLFSLTAGLASTFAMIFMIKIKSFGIIGISVIGSAVHNIVQLLVANFTVGQGVWFYTPYLLIAGTAAGVLIGYVCYMIFCNLKNLQLYIS